MPALQPLQRFHDEVVQHTDAGAAMGNAVVTFDQVHVLAPRGRFEVEMYLSSLKLTGQVRCPFQHLCSLSAQEACSTPVHSFAGTESGVSETKPQSDWQLQHFLLALWESLMA